MSSVNEYFENLPQERKTPMEELRNVINKNIPKGYEEVINYKMPSWVVPHSLYPAGYHCDPKLPLSLIGIVSQKNFIAMHHLGIYASPELLQWFVDEYPKHSTAKLDMGKGCIRFKKMDQIPYKLIGELAKKMPVKDWVTLYEKAFTKKK
jgi:uncharacterized protein YdhG (YjbR/CyaY superfamily)